MRNVKKLFGIGAAVAVLGLTGCAQNFGFGQPGFRFRGSCSPMQRQAYMTSNYYAARQKVASTQARFSFPSRSAPRPESWKRIASGECSY